MSSAVKYILVFRGEFPDHFVVSKRAKKAFMKVWGEVGGKDVPLALYRPMREPKGKGESGTFVGYATLPPLGSEKDLVHLPRSDWFGLPSKGRVVWAQGPEYTALKKR